jgi:hypothetical protein
MAVQFIGGPFVHGLLSLKTLFNANHFSWDIFLIHNLSDFRPDRISALFWAADCLQLAHEIYQLPEKLRRLV